MGIMRTLYETLDGKTKERPTVLDEMLYIFKRINPTTDAKILSRDIQVFVRRTLIETIHEMEHTKAQEEAASQKGSPKEIATQIEESWLQDITSKKRKPEDFKRDDPLDKKTTDKHRRSHSF